MSDQTPSPTPPPPPEPPPAAEPAPAAPPPPRPSWTQVLVAVGAVVAVLMIGGLGFAIGRATAGNDDGHGRIGQEQRFDDRGPGGPGMMPPGLSPNGQDEQQRPDSSDDDGS
jgi:hypothetical protein